MQEIIKPRKLMKQRKGHAGLWAASFAALAMSWSGSIHGAIAADAAPTVAPAEKTDPAVTAEAQTEIAERVVDHAQDQLQLYVPSSALWHESIAEIQAGMRLSPDEPRYPRMLAEAMVEVGDTRAAIDALNTYRAILVRLQMPEDQVADARLIDLYLAQLQTVDERIKYLKDMLSVPTLAPEVQSHAAVLAVPLLLERSRAEAEAMVKQATRLNPLNARARQYEYELIASQGTRVEQMESLLAMVRANPANIPALSGVARELASAGLSNESLAWFERALSLYKRAGAVPDIPLFVDYVAELYQSGYSQSVDELTSQLLSVQPENVDAWLIRLVLHREGGQGIAYDQEVAQARQIMDQRASAAISRVVSGAASSQPTGAQTTPVDMAVLRLKQGRVSEGLRADFLSAAIDAAWFELYFDRREPDAKRWVQVLEKVLPPNDMTLIRLQGWLALLAGDSRQAQAKLSSIQDRDPLAALGIISLLRSEAPSGAAPASNVPRTNPSGTPPAATLPKAASAKPSVPASRPGAIAPPPAAASVPNASPLAKADAMGRRLLEQYPTGIIGVMIKSALRDRNLQPDQQPVVAALKAELGKFPAAWLDILDKPEKFYLLIGNPRKLSYKLGEPMLARVALQNTSSFDIPIGPDSALKPDLWFDAKVSLSKELSLPMAVYDKIANVLVLKSRLSSSQDVRINQGKLGEVLLENPAASMSVYITAMTNPQAVGPTVEPGPVGLRRQFLKQFIRKGFPVTTNNEKQKLYKILVGSAQERGLPAAKIAALDTLEAYVREGRKKGAEGRLLALGPEMLEQINKVRRDEVPEVGLWATYDMALLNPQDLEPLTALANSPQWLGRLLAVIASGQSEPATQKRVLAHLAEDPDPQVRAAATAQLQLAAKPPQLRPTAKAQAPTATQPGGPQLEPSSGTTAPATPAQPTGDAPLLPPG